MINVFYDTEFLEDGDRIQLISIGMVRADGKTLYRVNSGMDLEKVLAHPWLPANVVPHLPVHIGTGTFDPHHEDFSAMAEKDEIAADVSAFLLEAYQQDPRHDLQLWAWFASYDHVMLASLFGNMSSMPFHIPMWTNDLRQEVERLNCTSLPQQLKATKHHALNDAWHLKRMYDSIKPWGDEH